MSSKQKTAEGFISKATLSNVRVSPRRARLVVDLVRGKPVGQALEELKMCDKKTGPLLHKLILSAVANAKQKEKIDVDELVVKRAFVNEGKTLNRWMPRAQGRATPIRKRHSSITVLLDEL